MTALTRDPLLLAARAVVLGAMGLSVLVGIFGVIAGPLLILFRDSIKLNITINDAGHPTSHTFLWVGILLLAVIILSVLVFLFLRHLRRIIDTVGHGDPFIPANAGRLAAMGWLVIAIEALTIPGDLIGTAIETGLDSPDVHIDFGISFGSVVLAIVLFVLARVFRKGAEMRDELEGMV